MKKLLFIVFIAVFGLTACGPTPEELVKQGKMHLENENYTEALTCFQKAAEAGNAEAEYNIANFYADGIGVAEDIEMAAEWLKKAAEKDYPEAQNALAAMYYRGIGLPQDFEKAAKWAKKAASYDIEGSQFILASLYFAGKGVPQDFDKAAELFLKVENKGGDLVKEAQSLLFIMYLKGLGVPQNDDKAAEMLRNASDLTLAEAQFKIGDIYNQGDADLEIAVDVKKAVRWFRMAAENGDAQAQNYMGIAYYQGKSVTKSVTDAKYWWQKSADQGNVDAQKNLKDLAGVEKAEREKREAEARRRAIELENSKFSVGPDKKVCFAKGNLQYCAQTNTWRFAEHQWDVVGELNEKVSPTYGGWIDLFCWGTSGYNGKMPYMTSRDYNIDCEDIAGTNYDWGRYANISNSGEKQWRTLTSDEWKYVVFERQTKSGVRYAKAIVHGVQGLILVPDNWDNKVYTFNEINEQRGLCSTNTISNIDWMIMEDAGAIFLPVTGWRRGLSHENPLIGYYRASDAKIFQFYGVDRWRECSIYGPSSKENGFAVRLASDIK